MQKHRGTDMAEAETHSDPGVSKAGTADGISLKREIVSRDKIRIVTRRKTTQGTFNILIFKLK